MRHYLIFSLVILTLAINLLFKNKAFGDISWLILLCVIIFNVFFKKKSNFIMPRWLMIFLTVIAIAMYFLIHIETGIEKETRHLVIYIVSHGIFFTLIIYGGIQFLRKVQPKGSVSFWLNVLLILISLSVVLVFFVRAFNTFF